MHSNIWLTDWLVGWLIDWCRRGETYVSEPRPPTDLFFIPRVICEHGEPWWWWWWCRLGITPDSSTRGLWQSYQHRLLGPGRRNGGRRETFAYQYLRYVNGSLTCRKILRHGASGFTSLPKKVCCWFLSPLKIHRLGCVWTRDPCFQWQAH
jgi:hypothetical protein